MFSNVIWTVFTQGLSVTQDILLWFPLGFLLCFCYNQLQFECTLSTILCDCRKHKYPPQEGLLEIAREEGYQKHFKEESLQELKFPVGFGGGGGGGGWGGFWWNKKPPVVFLWNLIKWSKALYQIICTSFVNKDGVFAEILMESH